MPLEAGKKAPAFTLESTDGSKISLKDFAGKQAVVLYFYPRDMTPGCTTEACDFRDSQAALKKLGVAVLGVSTDTVESHQKFTDKHELSFPLLADTDNKLAEKYGAWVEKNNYGKKYMGIQRATFLIDKAGKIARVWPKVKVDGHVAEVVEAARELA